MANEKRLIDANALKSAIDDYMKMAYDCPLDEVAEIQGSTNDTKLIYAVEGLYEATEIIDNAPTVDAVEVVHGRWVVDAVEVDHPFLEFESVYRDVHQCSICKEYFDVSDARNYCPNCGAKMDGDGNG